MEEPRKASIKKDSLKKESFHKDPGNAHPEHNENQPPHPEHPPQEQKKLSVSSNPPGAVEQQKKLSVSSNKSGPPVAHHGSEHRQSQPGAPIIQNGNPNDWYGHHNDDEEEEEEEEEEIGEYDEEEEDPIKKCGSQNICEIPGEYDEMLGEGDGDWDLRTRMASQVKAEDEPEPNYKLNDFLRAKEFFMTSSTVTGLSLYEHFSELIRKLLDNRAPNNPADFVEELSLNLKRYRFGLQKDVIQDAYCMNPVLMEDSKYLIDNWNKHAMRSEEQRETGDNDRGDFGGFPNLLRMQYYLEQINIGLPREEMFRVALLMRQLKVTRPIARIRFWGKIFGTEKNYYVMEVELSDDTNQDVWETPNDDTQITEMDEEEEDEEEEDPSNSVLGAAPTFQRAGGAVTNNELLSAYQKTSGLANNANTAGAMINPSNAEFLGEHLMEFPDSEHVKDAQKWQEYQQELMLAFPVAKVEEIEPIPSEEPGQGVNRRIFYVCNNLTEDCVRLPPVTPEQINISRCIRWYLTGKLNAKVRSVPTFPGREIHYLRALLARITELPTYSSKGHGNNTGLLMEELQRDMAKDALPTLSLIKEESTLLNDTLPDVIKNFNYRFYVM